MDTLTLKANQLVQDFFTSIEAAENTRRNYLSGLRHYTDLIDKTPDELIEEAEQEIMDGVLMRKRKIKLYLLRFREYLELNKYAPSSRSSWTAAVHSFYVAHDIDLPRMKMRDVQPLQKNNKPLPTRNDILNMLAHATPRMRAMILVIASSGMAQNEMRHQTVGAFMDGRDKDNVTTLQVRRIKVSYDYITFLSPEATEAVLVYIADRERREGHKLGGDDLIFATRTGKPTDRRDIVRAFARVAKQSGITNEANTFNRMRPHAIRKFFYSILLNNGASLFFAKFLMGHKIDVTHEAYFRAAPAKIKEMYVKFLPFLSIENVEARVIESAEFTELKEEHDAMSERVKELEQRNTARSEILDLIAENPEILNALKGLKDEQ